MTFEELNLNRPLLNALEDLGFTSPTPIQEKVFSVVMSGKDVCGIAQTGTGKTYAYLLPCLRQYQFSKEKIPQILIIVPTRELVVQVVEEVQKLSKYLSLIAVGVFGGVNLKPQAAEVMAGADVLVGTPGRLVDLLSNGVLKPKSIRRLVIDEFDEMLNLGFRAQLKQIFEKLPEKRQNLLFSATLNEEVEFLVESYFNNPVRIEATPVGTPLDNISQSLYCLPNFQTKINLLNLLLNQYPEMNKVLVFVATKHLADLLFEQLDEIRYQDKIAVIHSNKAQNHRFEAVNMFQNGDCRILIATDVIARGIDVAEVSHVINFDLPDVPENYIHRIGRTGRVERKGIAISFVTEKENELLESIETLMNYSIPVMELPENLEISDKLLQAEVEKVAMKTVLIKAPKRENAGAAFHEKSEKNSKVNVRRSHEAEMKKKYGKSYKKKRRDS
ncbi:ATP-dependent RNA helicase RhlE [Pseudarcicella hirudinis]|uniref:ATP-dependent RNA helicase RhlE n=1 Tax=Pseudarcicella hirudinis TaxID=1079859 RepID=A0A1I5NW30_9BACT|nr:DEAD/DEAH box helicase [Pseudarcicella hirudinis]SFP25461.1 ATP-dependent RNA helicase RhlE [Pseudarcicella hirudinis]